MSVAQSWTSHASVSTAFSSTPTAMLYASWPVEQPALHSRSVRRPCESLAARPLRQDVALEQLELLRVAEEGGLVDRDLVDQELQLGARGGGRGDHAVVLVQAARTHLPHAAPERVLEEDLAVSSEVDS